LLEQAMQAVWPACAWYFPAVQLAQEVAFKLLLALPASTRHVYVNIGMLL